MIAPWFEKPFAIRCIADMFKSNALEFVRIMRSTERFLDLAEGRQWSDEIGKSRRTADVQHFVRRVAESYRKLGGKQSAWQCERALEDTKSLTWDEVRSILITSLDGFYDTIEDRACVLLKPEDAKLFASRLPFGAKVAKNFPSAMEDIREAAKCFAFERWNASAFHVVRAVEFPIKATYTAFKITPGKKSPETWGDFLNEIEPVAFAKPTILGKDLHEFGKGLCGYARTMKRIRDSRLMHVDEPLLDHATSKNIYLHGKTMMLHIAQHLDEHGVFTP